MLSDKSHLTSVLQITKKLYNLFFIFLFTISILSGVFVKTAFSAAPVAIDGLPGDYVYEWTKSMGGPNNDMAIDVAVDSSDNIYMVGAFWNTVDFDYGVTEDIHVSNGFEDIFITKINSDGSYGWTRTFGNSAYQRGQGVAVDLTGNVYAVGGFNGTIDFDPDGAGDVKVSSGGYDAFITKINADGSYGWTKIYSGDGANGNNAFDVVVDSDDSVYIGGYFSGTLDFDLSAGLDERTTTTSLFVTKLNSDGSYGGTYTLDSASGSATGAALAVDSNNSVFVTGRYYGEVDFDFTGGTDIRSTLFMDDSFLLKINSDGTYGGVSTFNSTDPMGMGMGVLAQGVAVDPDGNAFVTGLFSSTIDFDDSAAVDEFTSGDEMMSTESIFLTKINSDGSYGWTRVFDNGYDFAEGLGVTADNAGNAYITGRYYGTIDFDPTEGTDIIDEVYWGTPNTFVTKIRGDGSYGWARAIHSDTGNTGEEIVFSNNNLYLTGYSWGATTDFDASSGVDMQDSNGYADLFLTKISLGDSTLVLNEDSSDISFLSATDSDGDSLTYSIVGFASYGTVTMLDSSTGEFSYTPDANYNGSDSFTFKVNDGTADSNIATVNIIVSPVNDAPQTSNGVLAVDEDTPTAGFMIGSDPIDGDSVTFTITQMPTYGGAVSYNSTTGLYTYTPGTNQTGFDRFWFIVNDGMSDSNYAKVDITISPINDEPSLAASDLYCDMNLSCGTQAYVSDVDAGDSHSYSITTLASFGSATVDGSGYVTYTPDADYTGSDYFVVTVTDSGGLSATVGINVTVDGVSLPAGDTNTPGIGRGDGGSDGNNLDTFTGNPVVDIEYVFSIVFKDSSGNAPQSAMLYLTNRTSPSLSDYFTYDLICTGDYSTGATCSYTTILPPSAVNNFHFEIVRNDGTLFRYPSAGDTTGPQVEMLNNYAMLSVARDIDSATLDSNGGFDCNVAYRWVSTGLSRASGNKGAYELVDGSNPLRLGEAYFVERGSCGAGYVPELPIYSDLATATHEVTLEAGWNIISNPYGGKVRLADITVQRGAEAPIAWDDAVSEPNEWVINGVYYSDGADWGSTYTVKVTPDATLTPWLGYWVYLGKDDDTYKLIFTKP